MKIFQPITASIALAALLWAGNINANTIGARGYDADVTCSGACMGFDQDPTTILSNTWAFNYPKQGSPDSELDFLKGLLSDVGLPTVSFVNKITNQPGNSFMTDREYFSIKKKGYLWFFKNNSGENITVNWSGESYSHVTEYGASAVPIPAAVWLFGSGLLGLVGLSRKKVAQA